jgi:hypothetical protein
MNIKYIFTVAYVFLIYSTLLLEEEGEYEKAILR